jgi:hypothetical protein
LAGFQKEDSMIHHDQVSSVADVEKGPASVRWSTLTFAVVALLFLFVALTLDTYRQYQTLFLETENTANAVRNAALQRTTHFLGQSRSLVSKLAEDPKQLRRVTENCTAVLAELATGQPVYPNLTILDGHGHVLCDTKTRNRGLAPGPDMAADFQELARIGQFSIGKPARSASSERWVARLLYPVKDNTNRLVGAIFLSMDLLRLDMIDPSKIMPPKSLVGIVNGDGTLVARSEGGMLRIGQRANSDAAREILLKREGAVRGVDFLGSDRLFSFAPIPDSDWILFASVDLEESIATFVQLMFKRLAVCVVLVLASAGVLYALWRRAARQKAV